MGHEHEHHDAAGHGHGSDHSHPAPPEPGGILYLDCFSGVSGDMLLGALSDLGVAGAIDEAVAALGIPGARIERSRVERSGIQATKADVRWQEPQPGRDHAEIQALLSTAHLPDSVRGLAARTFQRLADAESRVHGVPADRVHFHEVGSVDAIVDIVGTCAGVAALGARVVASPLPLGGGMVKAAHGPLPVPGPATLILLEGAPVRGTHHDKELVTPTGAALVTTLATAWGPLPPMRPRAQGWGAGTWELPDRPNLLRAVLGDSVTTETDGFVLIETNVDDMTPEVAAHAADQARAAGALDVWVVPILMKKGRPAIEIRALCPSERRSAVARAILRETTTLGIRIVAASRLEADRRIVEVETRWGRVPVKVGVFEGEEINAAPEMEACREIAQREGVPLKRVLSEAMSAYLKSRES